MLLEHQDVITEFSCPSEWKELSKETGSEILPSGDGSREKTEAPHCSHWGAQCCFDSPRGWSEYLLKLRVDVLFPWKSMKREGFYKTKGTKKKIDYEKANKKKRKFLLDENRWDLGPLFIVLALTGLELGVPQFDENEGRTFMKAFIEESKESTQSRAEKGGAKCRDKATEDSDFLLANRAQYKRMELNLPLKKDICLTQAFRSHFLLKEDRKKLKVEKEGSDVYEQNEPQIEKADQGELQLQLSIGVLRWERKIEASEHTDVLVPEVFQSYYLLENCDALVAQRHYRLKDWPHLHLLIMSDLLKWFVDTNNNGYTEFLCFLPVGYDVELELLRLVWPKILKCHKNYVELVDARGNIHMVKMDRDYEDSTWSFNGCEWVSFISTFKYLNPKMIRFEQIDLKTFLVNFYTKDGDEIDYVFTKEHEMKCVVVGCHDPRLKLERLCNTVRFSASKWIIITSDESCGLFVGKVINGFVAEMKFGSAAAGSSDRPPMLATGRYAQWRSRFLQYIDTRPNGDALRKCILKGPYTPTIVTTPTVPATEDSSVVPEQTTVETSMNMTPENRAHFESEQEAIHLILTGIGDEIYSTIDACQTAQEMWKAIKRLQQGESLNIQDVKTNLFWEFGQFTSHDGEWRNRLSLTTQRRSK
ncbi:hypothetical protein Tco_1484153 [Tanacetum coccineum]